MVEDFERRRRVFYEESGRRMLFQYERVSCGNGNGRYRLVYLNVSEVELCGRREFASPEVLMERKVRHSRFVDDFRELDSRMRRPELPYRVIHYRRSRNVVEIRSSVQVEFPSIES